MIGALTHWLGFVFSLLLLHVLTDCAQQGAPQGGPPDTTAPTVIATEPATGAVQVSRDVGITIEFSEPMENTTLLPNLLLSPPRTGNPQVKWSDGGRRVHLHWLDSLRADATYRITIGSHTTDRHNNPFKSPFTFAFSTGAAVDLGRIVGRVRSPGEKVGVLDIFAYHAENISDTFWLCPPDYLTQTGEGGGFDLPYVKAGRYRLLAFSDGNRNHRLNPGESFGLAHDAETTDEKTSDSLFVFASVYDTSSFQLSGCAAIPGGGITLRFSHPVDTGAWGWVQVRVRDSASGAAVTFALLSPTPRQPASILALSDEFRSGLSYTLHVSGIRDQRGRELSGSDSCRLIYSPTADSAGVRIENVHLPTNKEAVSPRAPIVWNFSEPVDTSRLQAGTTVSDSGGAAIPGVLVWSDARTLRFEPMNTWPESTLIVAAIDSNAMVDRAGNPPPRQLFRWTFTPLTAALMGTVEGRIEIRDSQSISGRCRLALQVLGGETRVFQTVAAPGPFRVDLPGGRWLLGGYLDVDGDGRWNPGALAPYAPPEPRVQRDDTLVVRPRFTLEDIVLAF
ncbi:MAG: Ig-like domain-containing protein [Candidatus Zixiibacteriota bacterium]